MPTRSRYVSVMTGRQINIHLIACRLRSEWSSKENPDHEKESPEISRNPPAGWLRPRPARPVYDQLDLN